MADEDLGTARVEIEFDVRGAEEDARRLGQRINRALDRSIEAFSVRVEADLRPFEGSINTLANLPALQIEVSPELTSFVDEIQAELDTSFVSIRVAADVDFTRLDREIGAHEPPEIEVEVDTDRFQRSLTALSGAASRTGSALTSFLRFGALGVAATGAAQAVTGVAAALAPAAGAIAALPAVFLGAKIAMGTFKLATAGVGEALSALAEGDAAKFAEALENLSPAAQEALKGLQELAPALKEVQQGIQDAFFKEFGSSIKAATENLLPLRTNLEALSSVFGRVVRSALDFAATAQAQQNLASVIDGVTNALSGLEGATGPVLKGFTDIAAAVSNSFGARAGDAIGGLGERLGTFLSGLAESGRAVELVENALTAFKQLGSILGNVGATIGNVFGAADAAGSGLLNNLEKITASFRQFTESAQGQEALRNIFSAVGAAASQLGPIINALLVQVGKIAPSILKIFETIGPAITSIINALGPAIQAIVPALIPVAQAIADVFSAIESSGVLASLGQAFAGIVQALTPILRLVGLLAISLGKVLAPALQAVTAFVQPVIEAFVNALSPVLPVIADALAKVAQALTPVFTLLGQLAAGIITALAPLLTQLADAFSQIVSAVAPLITQLVEALMPVLPVLIESFSGWVEALLPLIPAVNDLALAFVPLIEKFVEVVAQGAPAFAAMMSLIQTEAVIPIIEAIVTALASIIKGLALVLDAIFNFKRNAVAVFEGLKTAVTNNVQLLLARVSELWSNIRSSVTNAANNARNSVVSTFTNLKDRALSLFNSLVDGARNIFARLPSSIRNALSGAGSALFDVGQALVRGLVNGVRSAAGSLAAAARSVVDGAIRSAKNLLGISSPSKVFAKIGEQTGQGLVNGLLGSTGAVNRAADRMAGAAAGISISPGFTGSSLATTRVGGSPSNAAVRSAIGQNITFNITEVGNGQDTAQRVLNRLAASLAV